MWLAAASTVADQVRPIIADLSRRWYDPLSTSIFKAEKIVSVSYFIEEGSPDSGDEIVLKNGLGKTELVKRYLDGKQGYVGFGPNGFPCGKAKLNLFSNDQEFRRAKVIFWVYGERVKIESI